MVFKVHKFRPGASQVLTAYVNQRKLPHWTSYFVKYKDVVDDQYGCSHFNWMVNGVNYHILRTGCWPYIKYHCSKRPFQDLSIEDKLFRSIKLVNLGLPCLAYGIGAHFLISHQENVKMPNGLVTIYFLYKEDEESQY